MMDARTQHFAHTASYGEQLTASVWLVRVDDVDRAAFPEIGTALYVLYREHGRGEGDSECVDTETDAEIVRTLYRTRSNHLRFRQ